MALKVKLLLQYANYPEETVAHIARISKLLEFTNKFYEQVLSHSDNINSFQHF